MKKFLFTFIATIIGIFALIFSLILAIPVAIFALITGKKIKKNLEEELKKRGFNTAQNGFSQQTSQSHQDKGNVYDGDYEEVHKDHQKLP
ncbi:hypothetical protein N9R79_03635 [Vibrio sp.]|nr:hypothetical protein [Vibrio sp.]